MAKRFIAGFQSRKGMVHLDDAFLTHPNRPLLLIFGGDPNTGGNRREIRIGHNRRAKTESYLKLRKHFCFR